MRTVITLAILLLIATSAQAMDPAPAIEWERLYPVSTIYDVRESDENIAIGCLDHILLLDADGNEIWSTNSSDFGWYYMKFQSLIVIPGDAFVSTGVGKLQQSDSYSLFITKIDLNGVQEWCKNYDIPDSTEYGYSVIPLPDSGYAIAARKSANAWILRTDSQGDTLWTREWGWVYTDRAMSILYIDNGLTVLMHGSTSTTPGGPHLVRYDLDGNMLWETALDFPEVGPAPIAQAMCRASDGGLLVMDNLTPDIVHFDLLGNYDWHFNPPGWNNNWGLSVNTTMDGGIIFGGKNTYQPPGKSIVEYSGMISRHDSLGNELWRDYVYNSGCTEINSVRQLSQGGYIAAGRGSGQGLLIKYAPELGIAPGDLTPAVKITSVSPNPFSSSLSITCSLPSPMSASITVYGLEGRIVDVVQTGSFPAGEHTVQWNPSSELASGCYLIRLQTEVGTDVVNCVLLEN